MSLPSLPHPLFILAYAGALLAVVALSLIPPPEMSGPEGSDKVAHLIAYGVIAFCGGIGFRTTDARAMAASGAVAVGILLEFAQATWFDRNGSVWDAVANGAGAALGLGGAMVLLRILERASR
ncbi:MAG: VanZ family protein [Alphaproteobacteria bacterium]|nr:VanZ family protein [Alphaproteobacteria bacterium]